MEPPHISFFTPNPFGPGIIPDNAAIYGITNEMFMALSKVEREFLIWYMEEKSDGNLITLLIESNSSKNGFNDPILDIPQEYLCRIYMDHMQSVEA